MKSFARAVVLVIFGFFPALPVFSAEEGSQVFGLDECIRKALATAPELGESSADVDLAASKLNEAKAHRYPQIEFLGLIGPVPQARGDQVSSPDGVNDTDRWTVFERGDMMLTQPLYTFGKISESMRAARHGVEVDRARGEQRGNEIALKVREYYYGLLLAREMKELVTEVKEDLDKARDTARKLLDKGSSNVEQLDIYKLDAFAGEVGKFVEEAQRGERVALAALRTRIGLPPDAPMDIATERLIPPDTQPGELDAYIDTSRTRRPEYRQIKEGLEARAALVEAARANYWPDLFAAAYLSAANADKRTRIDNPFVPDQFNHLWAGIVLGVKWKLDFGITEAKVAAEQAQYNRLLHTRDYAQTNIPLQIRKAWLELKEAENSIVATKEAYSNSKKWAVSAIANFDFGIGPAREVFDSLQNYARMRAGYFQSIFNYRIAEANLQYATGEAPAR